eukprot:2801393-Rhodomonas_salina.2
MGQILTLRQPCTSCPMLSDRFSRSAPGHGASDRAGSGWSTSTYNGLGTVMCTEPMKAVPFGSYGTGGLVAL